MDNQLKAKFESELEILTERYCRFKYTYAKAKMTLEPVYMSAALTNIVALRKEAWRLAAQLEKELIMLRRQTMDELRAILQEHREMKKNGQAAQNEAK